MLLVSCWTSFALCFVLQFVGMLLSWFWDLYIWYIYPSLSYLNCSTNILILYMVLMYHALKLVNAVFMAQLLSFVSRHSILSCYDSFILNHAFCSLILVCNSWLLRINLLALLVGYTYVSGMLFPYSSEGFLVAIQAKLSFILFFLVIWNASLKH
jgi:hypothetical protein